MSDLPTQLSMRTLMVRACPVDVRGATPLLPRRFRPAYAEAQTTNAELFHARVQGFLSRFPSAAPLGEDSQSSAHAAWLG